MENTQSIDIFLVIVVGTLVILMIIFFIILFVLTHQKKVLEQKNIMSAKESEFQRDLLKASLEAAEQERARVAVNLHDDIGMMLSVLKMQVRKIARQEDREEVVNKLVPESNKLMDDTIQVVRNIMNDLKPADLEKQGLNSAFRNLCDRISSAGEVKVTYEGAIEQLPLDYKIQVHLYRLINEIMNNVLKHSGASSIFLRTDLTNNILITTIEHNGKGVSNDEIKKYTETSKGLGLKSIAARAQMLNAVIDYSASQKENPRIVVAATLQ